jgi:CheY-like chemotaxis protein
MLLLVERSTGARHEVEIFLPSTDSSPDSSNPPRPRYSLGGTETILLVEDQPEVRTVTHDTLPRHGYNVLEAANGTEAMSITENHGSDVRLLVTDVVMPGMSGRVLAELSRHRATKLVGPLDVRLHRRPDPSSGSARGQDGIRPEAVSSGRAAANN